MPTISNERRQLLFGIALLVIALAIMLAFSAATPAPETADAQEPFRPRAERFADAAGCRGWLTGTVAGVTNAVAARGPYEVAPGDIRAHRIRLASGGHEVTEWRCLGPALSERSWTHAMSNGEVAPFTMDDLNAMKF